MKQIIIKSKHGVAWAFKNNYLNLGGDGSAPSIADFGIDAGSTPMPVAGTFRNLVFYCGETHPDITVSLNVNGVDTLLSVAFDSADTIAVNSANEVVVAVGDVVTIHTNVATEHTAPGLAVGFSIEFEGDKQFYAVAADTGGQSAGFYRISGALGNGIQQNTSNPLTFCNTYSLCAVEGIIDGMCIRTFAGEPGDGVWTANIVLNGVLQDGSGGSVDTTVTMTGSTIFEEAAFSLPIVLADQVVIAVLRSVEDSPFANAQCSAAITFTPTDTITNPFMLVGGSNDSISTTLVGYKWEHSEQLQATEVLTAAPIAFSGMQAKGIYIEITSAPGAGKSYDYVVRRNALFDTAIATSIVDTDDTALVLEDVDFIYGDLIDIRITPSGGPLSNHMYWGLSAIVEEAPELNTIRVQKVTVPSDLPDSFAFTTSGGLSPGTFNLQDGEEQVFSDLADGTYGVTETPDSGFTTAYDVSNDDPHGAIELAGGVTVTVIVTNTRIINALSGIYEMIPGKTDDTLWVSFDPEATTDVEIPEPYAESGLIGE